jgi:hypothetical protein
MLTMGPGGCFTDGRNQENEGDRTMTSLLRYEHQYTQCLMCKTLKRCFSLILACQVLRRYRMNRLHRNSSNTYSEGSGLNLEILSLEMTAFWDIAPCSLVEVD